LKYREHVSKDIKALNHSVWGAGKGPIREG